MTRVVVTRSVLRTWLLALLGAVLLVPGVQMLVDGELVRLIGQVVYGRPDRVPARGWGEVVWGWILTVGGGGLSTSGLWGLIRPPRLVEADREGIRVAVNGPFRRPLFLPWEQVVDLRVDHGGDAGETFPVLSVVVKDPDLLPERPWGGRRADRWTMLVAASGWTPPAGRLVELVEELRSSEPRRRRLR